MKTLKNVLVIIIWASILVACNDDCITGNGIEKTKTLMLDPFENFTCHNSSKIKVKQGNEYKVVLKGDSNIIDEYLEVSIANNTCYFRFNSDCTNYYDLEIEITMPKIREINSTGSDEIYIQDFSNQSELSLNLLGSGNVNLNKLDDLESLYIKITGHSDVNFNTNTRIKNTFINIPGSGYYRGYNVISENCNISIPGSGKCEVFVSSKLKVSIPGNGKVYYKGDPEIRFSNPGSGKLINTN